jgi:hypothetical protein
MRNVRMTLPEYISNVTLFKQAERILINKGIISEIKLGFKDIKLDGIDKSVNEATDIKIGSVSLNEDISDELKQMGYSNSDIEDFMDEWKQGGSKLPKKVKDYLDGLYNTKLGQLKTKHLREVKDTSATGYYNQDGKEQYGKFNELDNLNAQEIMAGYVMEKQDNPNIDQKEAVKLVIKNLKSDQFYYTNYKLTGIRGLQPTEFTSTKRKPFFDEMEEVNKNGDNFVDEKNKMQIVKEVKIEDVKSLLSDTTLKNSQIGNSNGGVSIIYDDYRELPYKDLDKLRNSFIVDEDKLSDIGETDVYQYYLSDKMNEVMKPDSKLKLKELVRKMMKEMFDGRDNLTDIE